MVSPFEKNFSKQVVGHVDGREVFLFRISNGLSAIEILNFGGIITSVNISDRNGGYRNVVAGFENFESYTKDHPYFGCIVGRYANRIAQGRFSLDGIAYQLSRNDGGTHLHGGVNGFDKKVWSVNGEMNNDDGVGMALSYESADGEEGYPGKLNAQVSYTLTRNNELVIVSRATASKATPVNLTNHTYFNLTGFDQPTILSHELMVNSSACLDTDNNDIPTGKLIKVRDTPFDFRTLKKIGHDINTLAKGGYNHCFVLDGMQNTTVLAAELYEPESGRVVRVFTNQPGLQVYTSHVWDGSLLGAQGKRYVKYGAVALEAQNFPDAPNHPAFPVAILRPGELYQSTIKYQFLTR